MATVKIKGMSCQHCVGSVKEALSAITEISAVDVNLEKGEAYYEGNIDINIVKQAVMAIGFEVV